MCVCVCVRVCVHMHIQESSLTSYLGLCLSRHGYQVLISQWGVEWGNTLEPTKTAWGGQGARESERAGERRGEVKIEERRVRREGMLWWVGLTTQGTV